MFTALYARRMRWAAWPDAVRSARAPSLAVAVGLLAVEATGPRPRQTGYWAQPTVRMLHGLVRDGLGIVSQIELRPQPGERFTIDAGVMGRAVLAFVRAWFIGRGSRCLPGGVFGVRVEPWIRRWVEWLGWLSITLMAVVLARLNVRG